MNLRELYLNGTAVADLSPLQGLMNLRRLELVESPVSDDQVQTLQESLPELLIRR